MTRTPSRLATSLIAGLFAASLSLPAVAQTSSPPATTKKPPRPANLEKLDDIPPPPNTLIDPKVKPEETIREEGGNKIVEYRMKGKVYKMRVIKPDGTAYWLIDPKGDGKFIVDEKGVAPTNSVPMWVVYEW